MAKVKVIAKYFAFPTAKPKNGPTDGEYDSPDITEAERFEIFLPSGGYETKQDYIAKIRESGDINSVEKRMYGKTGNIVRFYKFQDKKRLVLNTKEQFDDVLENIKGNSHDAKIHVKIIPNEVLWNIGPGGSLSVQRKSEVNSGKPSKVDMEESIKVDKKVKEIQTLLDKVEKIEGLKVFRSGNNVFIFCKCGKQTKARKERGPASNVTSFLYDHYNPFHRQDNQSSSDSDTQEETRIVKKRQWKSKSKSKERANKVDEEVSDASSSSEAKNHTQRKKKRKLEAMLASESDSESSEDKVSETEGEANGRHNQSQEKSN